MMIMLMAWCWAWTVTHPVTHVPLSPPGQYQYDDDLGH